MRSKPSGGERSQGVGDLVGWAGEGCDGVAGEALLEVAGFGWRAGGGVDGQAEPAAGLASRAVSTRRRSSSNLVAPNTPRRATMCAGRCPHQAMRSTRGSIRRSSRPDPCSAWRSTTAVSNSSAPSTMKVCGPRSGSSPALGEQALRRAARPCTCAAEPTLGGHRRYQRPPVTRPPVFSASSPARPHHTTRHPPLLVVDCPLPAAVRLPVREARGQVERRRTGDLGELLRDVDDAAERGCNEELDVGGDDRNTDRRLRRVRARRSTLHRRHRSSTTSIRATTRATYHRVVNHTRRRAAIASYLVGCRRHREWTAVAVAPHAW